MPESTSIQEIVMKFIHNELLTQSDESVDPEENLFTGGRIDSLGIMQLIAHLESTLEIKIPPQDLIPENFRSVSAMTTYLQALSEQ